MSTQKHHNSNKDVIRLVVISDTHGEHEMLTSILPQGDILIHCGDFVNKGNVQDAERFVHWLSTLNQYGEKIVIDGNHDRSLKPQLSSTSRTDAEGCSHAPKMDLDRLFSQVNDRNVHFLQDDLYETRDGLIIYGISWNSCKSGSIPQTFSQNVNINNGVSGSSSIQPDIILAHSPPYLSRSITIPQVGRMSEGWRMSKELTRTVIDNAIPLCLSGHVHWCREKIKINHDTTNVSHMSRVNADKSIFVNASSLQSQGKSYRYMASPIIIDFDMKRKVPTVSGL